MQNLRPKSSLQGGKYIIEKELGQGGFGITYLAIQSGLDRRVAIKEFFMKELCERDESTSHVTLGTEGSRETVNRFREKFLKEARSIAKLDHPNIVSVIDVFEENGTAYYVMKFAENGSLSDKVKREGYLSEPVATRYILQIAEALDYIHQQKMNHLDVKPANIMLNEKDDAVLIDFGLSKQYDAETGSQTSTTPVGISHGYAPMEQYREGGVKDFSPETDIYALGATFFKLLTGVTPPSASDVNEDGVPVNELKAKGASQKAIDVICKAMESRKKDRMKDARTFIDGLSASAHPANDEDESTIKNINTDDESTLLNEKDDESTLLNDRPKKINDQKEAAKAEKDKAEAHTRAIADAERRKSEVETQRSKHDAHHMKVANMFGKISLGVLLLGFVALLCVALFSLKPQEELSYEWGDGYAANVSSALMLGVGAGETEEIATQHAISDYNRRVIGDIVVSILGIAAIVLLLTTSKKENSLVAFKKQKQSFFASSSLFAIFLALAMFDYYMLQFIIAANNTWKYMSRGMSDFNPDLGNIISIPHFAIIISILLFMLGEYRIVRRENKKASIIIGIATVILTFASLMTEDYIFAYTMTQLIMCLVPAVVLMLLMKKKIANN